jgi:hypothetical protein
MNKKGSAIGVFFIIILLIGVVAVGVTILSPSPSPQNSGSITGSAVYSGASNTATNTQATSNCGDYGEICCSGGYCDYGECQNNICVHCGYFGETCCNTNPSCQSGSTCVSGRCKVTEEYNMYDDCGHIGYKPCYDSYGAYCYTGVVNTAREICEACGDYEQPCCQNTDYECDYGICVYGICKKQTNTQQNTNTYTTTTTSSTSSTSSSSSSSGSASNCGYLNGPCCESGIYQDSWGQLRNDKYCLDDGLECRADVCVHGAEYESSPRPGGYY